MTKHRPVCYYIMNNAYVEEDNAFFERHDKAMKNHLNPLFIRAKVENVGINKILVNGGAMINLMPHFMLKKIGQFDIHIKPHNMVLSNYEGKIGYTFGVIQVDLIVGTIIRPTMFMVIASKADYNMLLGREWIHDIWEVPSSLHQRISIWRKNGIVENIEADQGYFMAEVNYMDKRHFDKNLENIASCSPVRFTFVPTDTTLYSLYLHPTHSFQWDREVVGEDLEFRGTLGVQPIGWGDEDSDYV